LGNRVRTARKGGGGAIAFREGPEKAHQGRVKKLGRGKEGARDTKTEKKKGSENGLQTRQEKVM